MKDNFKKYNEEIEYFKSINVKFNYFNENKALKYLIKFNNFDSLLLYCNNFRKYNYNGIIVNKYIDLDFSYLVDLYNIDYEFRSICFNIIMNIESCLKLRVLDLLDEFEFNEYITYKLYKEKSNNNYDDVWEFINNVTFGELIRFYDFLSKELKFKRDQRLVFILRDVCHLRNSVAHNRIILGDLLVNDNNFNPSYDVIYFLKKCNIKNDIREKLTNNINLRRIVYMLYLFNYYDIDEYIKDDIIIKLNYLFKMRMLKNKNYYVNNKTLISFYENIILIVDYIFYNTIDKM